MSDDQPGGINMDAGGDATIGGDAVGRDKITSIATHYYGPLPAQPRRAELPHQPYFFGREEELARITDALDPESAGWGVLIDGPGGIGKTALAIRAGHLAPDQHFPTKIFLSAKVRELTPQGEKKLEDFMLPNYMALLTELARELGDEDIAKIDPNERPKAVRRALENRQALIIIDNLETLEDDERERLFRFLDRLPRSCKAIVTSRRRTDVAAKTLRLDRLTLEAAKALIAKLAERYPLLAQASDVERQQLYETAGGNPLLIEWLVGQLGRKGSQCRTIPQACDFLRATPPDNDPLEYIFGDLVDTFTESETAVLSVLTHFTLPAQTKWIAELANLVLPATQTALEDLTNRALLISDAQVEAYGLPPLAATFLRRKRPKAIAQTGKRLTDRVLAKVLENGYRKYERFPLLEAEWPTIVAALPLFLEGDNARLQRLCDALADFLNFSGRWDERLTLNLRAEERAVTSNDTQSAGRRAYQAGLVHFLRGQASEVLACARRMEKHWVNARAREKAVAIHLRGLGHRLEKDYPAAIAAFQEMLALDRTSKPDSGDVSVGLTDLAAVEQLSGDYEAAERDYREALRISRKINDREGVAFITGCLADIALDRRDWPAAEALAREALPLVDALGRQDIIAEVSQTLATALFWQGRLADGFPHAQRAVEIFTKLHSPQLEKAQAVLKECEGVNG